MVEYEMVEPNGYYKDHPLVWSGPGTYKLKKEFLTQLVYWGKANSGLFLKKKPGLSE